ncbi:MAG: hypothetical protein IJS61_00070 [Firmicutes bacterium]|nr:hypothetical protein [Bacillota bacterium]
MKKQKENAKFKLDINKIFLLMSAVFVLAAAFLFVTDIIQTKNKEDAERIKAFERLQSLDSAVPAAVKASYDALDGISASKEAVAGLETYKENIDKETDIYVKANIALGMCGYTMQEILDDSMAKGQGENFDIKHNSANRLVTDAQETILAILEGE